MSAIIIVGEAGMMTTAESVLVAPEVAEPLGCLVVKTQLCGKPCKCKRLNLRHGPYAWLVRYVPIEQRPEDKKGISYEWKYLGKPGKPEKAFAKLTKYVTHQANYQILEGKLKGFFEHYKEDEAFRKKIHAMPKTKID